MDDLLRDELGRPSVFKDERPLEFDYVPERLPEREEELRKLVRAFKSVLENRVGVTQSALITGKVGTGKTVLSKKFGEMVSEEGLDYAHINCRRYDTNSLAMTKVLKKYDENFPERGFSVEEMIRSLFNILEMRDIYLIVALDEVDFLIERSGTELLYRLSRLSDDSIGDFDNRISIIYISRKTSFKSELDESTRSTLRDNVVELEDYGKKELISILNQRVNLAFNIDTVSDKSLELISDIASRWGDARFAIELLWKAGKKADSERSEKVIPEHVRWAKAEAHPVVKEELFIDLKKHHLLILLALSRLLQKDSKIYATTGELKKYYEIVCEENNEDSRSHTQFWQYLQELNKLAIADAVISGKGDRGTTTHISLPDVPASMLEEEVKKYLEEKKKRR